MQAIYPYCGDRKVLKGYNDLRTTHPEIAREWNKERNGDLKPTNVITSSNKRVWWKCKEGHEWSGLIVNRARRGKADPGCPYCSGRKVLAGYNDLATTHPDMTAMWHPRMNRRLNPAGVQAVSRKPAWWRGECPRLPDGRQRQGEGQVGLLPVLFGGGRPERPIRLDWPSAPRRGRNGGGGSVPPAYRRDLAIIGLGGYGAAFAFPCRLLFAGECEVLHYRIRCDELPEAIEGELRSFDSEREK